MKYTNGLLAALTMMVVWCHSPVASANYVIDESQSFIQLDIWALGVLDISTPQLTDSDIAVPSGTVGAIRVGGLNGTVEFTGGTFSFLNYAGGDLEPAEYPDGTTVSPAPVPPGEAPANYGFDIDVLGGAIVGEVALRALVSELTSGQLLLTAGDFDATLVELGIPSGHVDYSLVGPGLPPIVPAIDEAGGADVVDLAAPNSAPIGSISVAGLIETLTLPIDLIIETELSGTAVSLIASGQIVATRVVPEPATVAMLALGLAGLVAAGRRR